MTGINEEIMAMMWDFCPFFHPLLPSFLLHSPFRHHKASLSRKKGGQVIGTFITYLAFQYFKKKCLHVYLFFFFVTRCFFPNVLIGFSDLRVDKNRTRSRSIKTGVSVLERTLSRLSSRLRVDALLLRCTCSCATGQLA